MVRVALSVVAVTLLCLGAGVIGVQAADFCIDVSNGSGTPNVFALKGFTMPGKGTCKEARGFLQIGPFWTTGIACGSSDGVNVTFSLTSTYDTGIETITDTFKLLRASPSTNVSGKECCVAGGCPACQDLVYAQVACSPATVPIPE